jgi:hypothetical protein
VQSATGDSARVLLRPLRWNGRSLELGPLTRRDARWSDDGLAFVTRPRAGDWVSLHWDFVCDRLAPAEAARLAYETRRTLTAVNRSPATAAALA